MKTHPFAGYRQVLNEIYRRVLAGGAKTVLDIGFGTGTLTAKLYEQGCEIWGQDFSENMMTLAKAKIPNARLFCGDFLLHLAEELKRNRYDAILATYSLHHLTDVQKANPVNSLLPLLKEGGYIYICDVAFETRAVLERCRTLAGDEWDDEECYFIAEEFLKALRARSSSAFPSAPACLPCAHQFISLKHRSRV